MKPQKITTKSFKKYGKLIDYPKKSQKGMVRNLWRIVHTETAKVGWRIAYLILRDQSIGRMECHLSSDETFEPVKGESLIFVSQTKNLEDIECFILDKPIVLFKGTWHGLIACGNESEIKVVENSKVTCRYWKFGFRIKSFEELQGRIL